MSEYQDLSNEKANAKGKKNKGLWIIIIILFIFFAGAVYALLQKEEQITDLSTEKNELLLELDEMTAHYDALIADKDSLNLELIDERNRLIHLRDSIQSLNNRNLAQLGRYRGEIRKLKEKNRELFLLADSLMVYSDALVEEKREVENTLHKTQKRAEQLETDKTDLEREVALGSILEAQAMTAYAIKVYKSGKEKETSSDRKADKIKTCFTLGKNLIAEKGKRMIFIRVTTPENQVIAFQEAETNVFSFNGEDRIYSASKEVMYDNQALDVCIYVDKKEPFTEGRYQVEAYTEGALIGEASFELK